MAVWVLGATINFGMLTCDGQDVCHTPSEEVTHRHDACTAQQQALQRRLGVCLLPERLLVDERGDRQDHRAPDKAARDQPGENSPGKECCTHRGLRMNMPAPAPSIAVDPNRSFCSSHSGPKGRWKA